MKPHWLNLQVQTWKDRTHDHETGLVECQIQTSPNQRWVLLCPIWASFSTPSQNHHEIYSFVMIFLFYPYPEYILRYHSCRWNFLSYMIRTNVHHQFVNRQGFQRSNPPFD